MSGYISSAETRFHNEAGFLRLCDDILAEGVQVAGTDETLPNRDDFNPTGCYLDADWTWGNFGGLDLSEAFARFCEDPDMYQEDFMFMGSAAFSYYFPVIERYIYESQIVPESEFDSEVEAMWILAHCINSQFTEQIRFLRQAFVIGLRNLFVTSAITFHATAKTSTNNNVSMMPGRNYKID